VKIERPWVTAGYVLATLVMTWPLVNYATGGEGSYRSDQWLVVWTLAWNNHALLTSDSLFQSNLFFPAADSLRFNEHLFGLSLLTLPLRILGASPVLAHNLIWWLAFPMNALAAFALAKRFTPNTLAAFVGGLVFAFSFYVMLHAGGHLHLIWLWPIPLSLLLLEWWFDAPSMRRIAFWTAVVLLAVLTSWYLAAIILLANGLMGLVLLATNLPERQPRTSTQKPHLLWRRRAVGLAAAAVTMVLCVWPFAQYYVGLEGGAAEIVSNSADMASYVVPPENTVIGRWWKTAIDNRPRSIFGERTLFLGWISLALSGIGLGSLISGHERTRRAWLFPLLTVVGLSVGFGPSLPWVGHTAFAPFTWIAALPGLEGLRAPARFAVLGILGLSGMTALGTAALAQRIGKHGQIIVVLLVPLMLTEWFIVDFPAGKPMRYEVPAVYLTPEIQSARALVSLPEYRGTEEWFLGGDYLYYSTAHWRPIVNGFGRTEPPGHGQVIEAVRAFPASASLLRELGVQYVVVHTARYGDGATTLLAEAATCEECRLATRMGPDYVYELVPP